MRAVVEPLLSQPEALKLSASEDDRGHLLTMDVARADMGRLIGREGEHIKAIRTILHVWGATRDLKTSLKLNEPAR